MSEGRPHRGRLESDPYRYICPDCGSHSVRELRSTDRPPGKTYAANGHGKRQARQDAKKRYSCQSCRERKTHVLDKKRAVAATDGGERQ